MAGCHELSRAARAPVGGQLRRVVLTVTFSLAFCGSALAQGSIFGGVANSDLSTPADSELAFFGYLRQTDSEIRLYSSDGAGYDSGNWWDDFQNYLDEAPGVPYDYFFFNTSRGEFFNLSKLVPDNSFQQEDVQLSPAGFPAKPTGLTGALETDNQVSLRWDYTANLTYHVYRRSATSNGSFFRLDNPVGDLGDAGVADSAYVDTSAIGGETYSYVIIAENTFRALSPPSAVVTVDTSGCCVGLTGNVDNDPDGVVDIGDVSLLIDYLYITHPPLACPEEANIDGDPDGIIDIGDLTWLINYLYVTHRPPSPCQ